MQLHEQIAAVFAKTGWSVAEFLERSGLDIDRSALQRRLTGDTPLRDNEIVCLVDTLNRHGFAITVTWPPKKKSKRAA